MADQTATVDPRNKVLATLALSTTPKEYEFTVTVSPSKTIACTCTGDWLWSDTQAGTYYPVAESPNGYRFKLAKGTTSLWFKSASGTPTLTPAVIGP